MIERKYDYIVIGSGSGGSVIANRLSANPGVRVALIEAGPSDRRFPTNLKTRLPVGNIFLIPHAKYNWGHTLAGNEAVGNRTISFPRGKLFGGCTSINGGVYIRGQREDYDEWSRQVPGWSFEDVLAAYREMENYHGGETPLHGVGGELDVGKPREFNDLSRAFVEAATQAGHRRNDDFAGAVQAGFGQYDLNQRRGVRLSSSRAFLHPALSRPNLEVLDECLARRIVVDGGRAVAVEAVRQGVEMTLLARSEIILCAGAINSPQLLMLSGIGPEQHLREHGIAVVSALEGVGAHLQDHPTVHIAVENPTAESYALSRKSLPRLALSPFQYLATHTGMLASNVAEAGGFVCTDPSADGRPDIQMTFLVGLKANARVVPREHGYMILVQLLRPKSEGSVRLASADPQARPIINPNFFDHPDDLATLMRGFREARRIIAQPALAKLSGQEIDPGASHQTEAELSAALRRIVNTAYHPTGTCKMGPAVDPMAVVDERLRVRGVVGLRVADASVMPSIISGNTSAPTMMIGARAARFIQEDNFRSNIVD